MKINLADSGLLTRLALGKQQEIEAVLAKHRDNPESDVDQITILTLEALTTTLILLAAVHAAKASLQQEARGPIVLPHGVLRGRG